MKLGDGSCLFCSWRTDTVASAWRRRFSSMVLTLVAKRQRFDAKKKKEFKLAPNLNLAWLSAGPGGSGGARTCVVNQA